MLHADSVITSLLVHIPRQIMLSTAVDKRTLKLITGYRTHQYKYMYPQTTSIVCR